MATAARELGWHPFPGPAAINSQTYDDRSGCMYHGFCNRGGCHVNAKNSTAVTTIPSAQATGRLKVVTRAHVTTIEVDAQRPRDRRQLRQGRRGVLPAGRRGAARRLHLRERRAAAALEVEGVSQRARRTTTARSAGTTSATTPARRVTALFPFDLNNWYGLPAQGVAVDNWADDNFDHAGLDFIGGGNLWVYSDRRPIAAAEHEHVRPGADLGLGVEGVHQGERRPLRTSPTCRRPRCPTRTTTSTSIPW